MKRNYLLWISGLIAMLIFIAVIFIFLQQGTSQSEKEITIDKATKNGLCFLLANMQEDGGISGPAITAWTALAIQKTTENIETWEKTKQYLINTTHMLNTSLVTDYERHALALMAFYVDPTNGTEINLIEKIMGFYDGTQIGDPQNLYDDCFGILTLRSYGMSENASIIQNVSMYIKQSQHKDGSWGDVDTTAAMIIALTSSGEKPTSTVLEEAKSYLKTMQRESGGFYAWGSENIASTSWAVCCINALYEDPQSAYWRKNNNSPIDFLLHLQQPNGSFNYTIEKQMNPEWMTAYALLALSGSSFTVSYKYEI